MEDNTKQIRTVSIPISKLDKNGSLPGLFEQVFDNIRKHVDTKGQEAVDKLVNTIRYRNIVPDMNMNANHKVDFTKDQTEIIQKQLEQVNPGSENTMLKTLLSSKNVRTFEPTEKMFAGFGKVASYAPGAIGMAYQDESGKTKYLTLKNVIESIKKEHPKATDLQLATYIQEGYNQNEFVGLLDGQSFFYENGQLREEYNDMPLLTKDIANLIKF